MSLRHDIAAMTPGYYYCSCFSSEETFMTLAILIHHQREMSIIRTAVWILKA